MLSDEKCIVKIIKLNILTPVGAPACWGPVASAHPSPPSPLPEATVRSIICRTFRVSRKQTENSHVTSQRSQRTGQVKKQKYFFYVSQQNNPVTNIHFIQ